jgi:hypothetical protein
MTPNAAEIPMEPGIWDLAVWTWVLEVFGD